MTNSTAVERSHGNTPRSDAVTRTQQAGHSANAAVAKGAPKCPIGRVSPTKVTVTELSFQATLTRFTLRNGSENAAASQATQTGHTYSTRKNCIVSRGMFRNMSTVGSCTSPILDVHLRVATMRCRDSVTTAENRAISSACGATQLWARKPG